MTLKWRKLMHVRGIALATGMALLCVASTNAANIDLFETPHSADSTAGSAPPAKGVGSTANPTATALGGERDLFANKTMGADGEGLRARVNPLGETKLRIDADSQVLGSVFVTWDGVDGNANPFSGIDFNGLGGFNLTSGANAFQLMASFSDVGGPVHFSVFDNTANSAGSVATASVNIPGSIPPNTPTAVTLPFSNFIGTTSALSNAGAILMEIQNGGSWDLNILSVRTVPEPSCIFLGLAGFAALLGFGRGKRRSVRE